jgi:hypothetical protein
MLRCDRPGWKQQSFKEGNVRFGSEADVTTCPQPAKSSRQVIPISLGVGR